MPTLVLDVNRGELNKTVDTKRAEGWNLQTQMGESATMTKVGSWGNKWVHLLLLAICVWFSFGVVNVLYAMLSAYVSTETLIIRANNPE